MIRHLFLASAALAMVTTAAQADEFRATQTVQKVVSIEREDGSTDVDYITADQVQPGEALIYRLDYSNESAAAAENVALVMAVPAEVTYSENSASSEAAAVTFSTDGGQSFAPRSELLTGAGSEQRQAVAEDITHIQWAFTDPIPVGAEGEVMYEAVVR
ncbi:MAG: hypothetical protein AAGJ50_09105 [Pseudomonadota bacterium]